jgi:hypothetical protein
MVRTQQAEGNQSLGTLPLEQLPLLTLNVPKAGLHSSSLVDIVSLLESHTPDFLLITETFLLHNNGALTHILRNRGYKIHYHPANAPSLRDVLPEARLPGHLTHPRGGCWISYRKHAAWKTHVRPLRLPADCPRAIPFAVEITLHSGEKAAVVASYLPQPVEEHGRTCQAFDRLPATLPHHLLILGGDLHDGWTCPNQKDAHIQTLPFLRWKGAEDPTFVPTHLPGVATCIGHLAIWDPRHISEQTGDTITLPTSFWTIRGSWGPYISRS